MRNISMLWPGGRRRALTLSYDDGVEQDRRLVALMNRYGIKGTFNINSGFICGRDNVIHSALEMDYSHIPADEIKDVYEGHEVAVHSVNHPKLLELSSPVVLAEIMEGRTNLEALIGSRVCGMTSPFGANDTRLHSLIQMCGIRYARGIRCSHGFDMPQNPYDWVCSCHHKDLEPLLDSFFEDSHRLRLLSIWGHSYEFDQTNTWDVIEKQLSRLGGHSSIWYATNREIFEYIDDFNNLCRSANGNLIQNQSSQCIWLEINGKTYVVEPGKMLTVTEEYVVHFSRLEDEGISYETRN